MRALLTKQKHPVALTSRIVQSRAPFLGLMGDQGLDLRP